MKLERTPGKKEIKETGRFIEPERVSDEERERQFAELDRIAAQNKEKTEELRLRKELDAELSIGSVNNQDGILVEDYEPKPVLNSMGEIMEEVKSESEKDFDQITAELEREKASVASMNKIPEDMKEVMDPEPTVDNYNKEDLDKAA